MSYPKLQVPYFYMVFKNLNIGGFRLLCMIFSKQEENNVYIQIVQQLEVLVIEETCLLVLSAKMVQGHTPWAIVGFLQTRLWAPVNGSVVGYQKETSILCSLSVGSSALANNIFPLLQRPTEGQVATKFQSSHHKEDIGSCFIIFLPGHLHLKCGFLFGFDWWTGQYECCGYHWHLFIPLFIYNWLNK